MERKEKIKDFYRGYADRIIDKRFNSPYPLRRYAHAQQYAAFLKYIKPGMKVLDAGCGEGVLSLMMARLGAQVTGCDWSLPNIENAKKYAVAEGVKNVEFIVGDAENLPFLDSGFDLVVSSHVLEHLPDFDRGLKEAMRVTKNRAVIAIPTILNLCSMVQVGRGWFYLIGLRSFAGLFIGLVKTFFALISGRDGVDENYGGANVPHVFRFPWVMKRKVKRLGFRLVSYEASSICLPYFSFLLPLVKGLDRLKSWSIFRNCGYGTTFVVEKALGPGIITSSPSIVLAYHSISDKKYLYATSPRDFERQLVWLKKHYRVVDLTEFEKAINTNQLWRERLAVITFDDGFEDLHTNAWPILQKLNLPATIFLPTRFIGQEVVTASGLKFRYLSVEQIGEMVQGGQIDFQGHTHNHQVLTEASPIQIEQEFKEAGEVIKKISGKDFTYFAYPKGRSNKPAESAVEKFYRLAFVGEGRVWGDKELNKMAIPRITIFGDTPLWKFKIKSHPIISKLLR